MKKLIAFIAFLICMYVGYAHASNYPDDRIRLSAISGADPTGAANSCSALQTAIALAGQTGRHVYVDSCYTIGTSGSPCQVAIDFSTFPDPIRGVTIEGDNYQTSCLNIYYTSGPSMYVYNSSGTTSSVANLANFNLKNISISGNTPNSAVVQLGQQNGTDAPAMNIWESVNIGNQSSSSGAEGVEFNYVLNSRFISVESGSGGNGIDWKINRAQMDTWIGGSAGGGNIGFEFANFGSNPLDKGNVIFGMDMEGDAVDVQIDSPQATSNNFIGGLWNATSHQIVGNAGSSNDFHNNDFDNSLSSPIGNNVGITGCGSGPYVPSSFVPCGSSSGGGTIAGITTTAPLTGGGTSGTVALGITTPIPVVDLPIGTVTSAGVLQPDGTTITVSGGIISAVGGGSGITGVASPDSSISVTTTAGVADIELPTSGVTAGSYTNSNITVNSKGIVTMATTGSGGGSGSPPTAGTWPCALNFNGSAIPSGDYGAQNCHYTETTTSTGAIETHLFFDLYVTSTSGWSSGVATITGIPITPSNERAACSFGYMGGMSSVSGMMEGRIDSGGSTLYLTYFSSSGVGGLSNSNFPTPTEISGFCSYLH